MSLADSMAGASFILITGMMAALVQKGAFSKEELAELVDEGILKLEESGLADDLQRSVHSLLEVLLKNFRPA
ncbi:MAG TPA: hypothetical protein VGU20_16855 [Stellaceae bacterium]|nr:hypothetical protein [Stellaceae bacterium]